MTSSEYCVVLFDSVQHAMKAEKILKKAAVPVKLIPVPKHISSNCGICLRFIPENIENVKSALSNDAVYSKIIEL